MRRLEAGEGGQAWIIITPLTGVREKNVRKHDDALIDHLLNERFPFVQSRPMDCDSGSTMEQDPNTRSLACLGMRGAV